MSLVALPTSSSSRRTWLVWLAGGVVALVLGGLVWSFSGSRSAAAPASAGLLVTVAPMDLEITIRKDGELQAVNNIEINCEVEGGTTIQTIVKEGASVVKGDVLITLDSSAIKQRIEDTTLDLQKAEADVATSHELREIQKSTNAANLEAAEVALTLAQLDLKQYEEGTYPQLLANAKTDLEMARINLKNMEEKLGQTRSLFAKGFVTATAVKEDELSVTTARNSVNKAETALKVLTEYSHQMDLTAKQNAVSQAEQRLARTQRENAAQMSQRNVDVSAKEQALAVLKRRMDRYQQQFQACTIIAPADGMVVYASTGDRNSDQRIQEGTQVRERQPLLRLPDTTTMKAVVRVQEGQVSRLEEGMRARVRIIGVPNAIPATVTKISVLADSGGRWFNPDLKEYPVDLVLDETPRGLKPGMGAVAEIYVDRARQVMAVPLSTIYSAGSQSFVFVRSGEQYTPREVQIGRSNETHAEILGDAIRSGEQVLTLQSGQGQELLDKAGIKLKKPTTGPSDSEFGSRRGGGRRNREGGGPGGARGGDMQQPPAGSPRSPDRNPQ